MLILISYILNSIILVVITIFLKFHWMLATQNKTTIENIEHCDLAYWSKYDVGKDENLKQIFGTNRVNYFLPVCGKPQGDGLTFPLR